MENVGSLLEKLGVVDTNIGNAVLVFREISENGQRETVCHGTLRMLTKYGTTSKRKETTSVVGIPWNPENLEREDFVGTKFTYYGALISKTIEWSPSGLIQKEEWGKLSHIFLGQLEERYFLFLPAESLPPNYLDGLNQPGKINV